MLTEFEIRRELALLEGSSLAPIRKARRILRLRRAVEFQLRSIHGAFDGLPDENDPDMAARRNRMVCNLESLNDEVQAAAYRALRESDRLPVGAASSGSFLG